MKDCFIYVGGKGFYCYTDQNKFDYFSEHLPSENFALTEHEAKEWISDYLVFKYPVLIAILKQVPL